MGLDFSKFRKNIAYIHFFYFCLIFNTFDKFYNKNKEKHLTLIPESQ